MLDLAEVTDLVKDVARTKLPGHGVESVSVEPSVGAFGDDILRITIVADAAGGDWPDGEVVLTIMGALRDRLEQRGDGRLPLVDLLTPQDLAVDVDPES
jgi:hypothetical protein